MQSLMLCIFLAGESQQAREKNIVQHKKASVRNQDWTQLHQHSAIVRLAFHNLAV